jgi:hypothetical protein
MFLLLLGTVCPGTQAVGVRVCCSGCRLMTLAARMFARPAAVTEKNNWVEQGVLDWLFVRKSRTIKHGPQVPDFNTWPHPADDGQELQTRQQVLCKVAGGPVLLQILVAPTFSLQ